MVSDTPTLEEKIGQLFILGFKGESVDRNHPIVRDIREHNLGGVILFDRLLAEKRAQNNIVSPDQVKTLTASLQTYADIPLLVAIDQEGGMVQRLKPETGFPKTVSAAFLGRENDSGTTATHAAVTAKTLHTLGINFNLAPVVDLNTFPENPVIGRLGRSFSASPDRVIHHAAIWIKEHSKEQLLSCLKHFPGHGSSHTDSHLGFTDISQSWTEEELIPFQRLIGDNLAQSVMLGHLFHRGLDPTYPTSLSSAVINDLLRTKLGFQGLIITDDLQMKAITDRYGMKEAVCLALAAGVDMIIVGNNLDYDPDILSQLLPAVVKAVKEEKIPAARIDEAWKQVQQMKVQLS